MPTFKIKLEDKAAFLNRLEKAEVALDTDQIVDNKIEGYFEVTSEDPKQVDIIKMILKQSPKINTINEMETKKKKMTKDELKEMVRQELQAVLAEKKKVKGEDKKEKLDEVEQIDEVADVLIAGLATLLGVGGTLVAALISDLRKAKTKEEKANILRRAADNINQRMAGGM